MAMTGTTDIESPNYCQIAGKFCGYCDLLGRCQRTSHCDDYPKTYTTTYTHIIDPQPRPDLTTSESITAGAIRQSADDKPCAGCNKNNRKDCPMSNGAGCFKILEEQFGIDLRGEPT